MKAAKVKQVKLTRDEAWYIVEAIECAGDLVEAFEWDGALDESILKKLKTKFANLGEKDEHEPD